ncbi:MAG: alpha-glucosidase [Piscinibacter sp.]|nr:alpha-glucosidase [Piscinibacter sp.]
MNSNTEATREWWRGSVIYQVYPRSFADSNGDGIGDLPGITAHLPYIADLGVDAIWLSPFFKSPMKDFGYDVADHDAVDPMFGRIDDFVALTARAHELGLRVIIDQVLSHTSDEHAWFVESRQSRDNDKADWYVWADAKPDGTPPNNWLSVFGGSAWQWDTRRRQYYLHNFLAAQPDLNFHCPAVQDALLETLGRWLDRGVDGFRLDAINFCFHDRLLRDNPGRGMPEGDDPTAPAANPYSWQLHLHDKSQPEALQFLRRVRALVEARGDATLLGEIGDERGMAMVAQYTEGGDKLHQGYCFDLLSAEHSAAYIRGVIERFEGMPGDGWPCWALSNHDCMRWATRWGGAHPPPGLLRLGVALQASLRGSVCLYQGEELGLPEAELNREDLRDPYGIAMWPEFKGRDGCRTPMPWDSNAADLGFGSGETPPWLPIAGAHRPLATDLQEVDPSSQLHHVRRLLRWRRTQPALIHGSVELLPAHPQVLAFVRSLDGKRVLCAFNLSDQAATMPLRGTERLGDLRHESGVSGARAGVGVIEFEPFGALFASLD